MRTACESEGLAADAAAAAAAAAAAIHSQAVWRSFPLECREGYALPSGSPLKSLT